MNDLTTPQHEKQIGYWVSEKGKRMKWLHMSMASDSSDTKTRNTAMHQKIVRGAASLKMAAILDFKESIDYPW